ncbi:MAG TPA: hypothetical protein VGG84_15240 [Gemmatimonadaceae bacterium]
MSVQPDDDGEIVHQTTDVDIFLDDTDLGKGEPLELAYSPSGRVELVGQVDLGALGREVVVSLPFAVLAAFVDEVREA